ncbi:DUF2877 domain-containing protein [Candidatus Riflebacteria bacterium]
MLLSVGDMIRDGEYKLHSSFRRVVNFSPGDFLVSIVNEEVGAGPLNIVVRNYNFKTIKYLKIDNNEIYLNGDRFQFDENKLFNSSIEVKSFENWKFERNLAILEGIFLQGVRPKGLGFLLDAKLLTKLVSDFERAFATQICGGVEKIFSENIISGVRMLRGCGYGLTPSGDDFISGFLFGLNFLQKIMGLEFGNLLKVIYEESLGENLFSNTSLFLASRGRVFSRLKDLLSSLLICGEYEINKNMEKLFSIGGSSGSDILCGLLISLKRGSALCL